MVSSMYNFYNHASFIVDSPYISEPDDGEVYAKEIVLRRENDGLDSEFMHAHAHLTMSSCDCVHACFLYSHMHKSFSSC